MTYRFALAAMLAVAGLMPPARSAMADDQFTAALAGSWSLYHPDDGGGPFRRGSLKHPVLTFSFEPTGWFSSTIFYPQAGGSGGEPLETSGKYYLVGNRLRILRPQISGGWLINDPEDLHQTCTLAMADDRRSFSLTNCIFAGKWTRTGGSPLHFIGQTKPRSFRPAPTVP